MPDPVVLFDIDGTLTDTNYLHTLAWRRAFLAHGHDVASSRVHRMIGASSSRLMEECIGAPDDAVKETWRECFEALIPEIRAFPGVQERGGRAVLATSSPGDLVEHHLRALDLDVDDLAGLTTDSDVDEAKPAPDVFRSALEQVGGVPEQAIVVGDTGWDVEAALGAGLSTVAVRTGGWAQEELVQAGAIEVHDDVRTILDHLDTTAVGDLLR
jgi:phosphoglycolate phosphatase-like HAD superfamily hydrolase